MLINIMKDGIKMCTDICLGLFLNESKIYMVKYTDLKCTM